MLQYSRTEVLEVIDLNKTSASKECVIYHYWYFLDKMFTFQPAVCNGCNYVLIMSMNLNNVDIFNIHGVDNHCIINGISKWHRKFINKY